MSTRRSFIIFALLTALTGCHSLAPGHDDQRITKQALLEFLTSFDKLAERKNFDLIFDMVHEKAFFRFNDGDFVGRAAVRTAYEKTWRSSARVDKERFHVSDVVVLALDTASASVTYTYNWEGVLDGRAFSIRGRGSRVILREGGRFQIVHTHLSQFPEAK